MVIPYRTAKLKSANSNGDLGPNCQIKFPSIFPAIPYFCNIYEDTCSWYLVKFSLFCSVVYHKRKGLDVGLQIIYSL